MESASDRRTAATAPVAARGAADHQPDGCSAALMAGQRHGAAVEEIDQPGVAHDAEVPAEIVLVAALGLGDRRRDARHARHDDGVERSGKSFDFADVGGAPRGDKDIVGPRDVLAQKHALADARIVLGETPEVRPVDMVGLGPGKAAALEVLALPVESRYWNFNH